MKKLYAVVLALVGLAALFLIVVAQLPPVRLAEGIFWQPTLQEHDPRGDWEQLGAKRLAVQWMIVEDRSWYRAPGLLPWSDLPDWAEIAEQPWAEEVIFGLAGYYGERDARRRVVPLARDARAMVDGLPSEASRLAYYFPVEVDPTWNDLTDLKEALKLLPRPLWISVYAHRATPSQLTNWVAGWLPSDVGVMFQDGVGVGVREPAEALAIADALTQRFGRERVILIAEVFRNDPDGFRSAWPWELAEQLMLYRGQRVYLFDGPHYLSRWRTLLTKVWAWAEEEKGTARASTGD